MTGQTARTVTYTYTLDGNRETTTYPNGHQLTYDYTARKAGKAGSEPYNLVFDRKGRVGGRKKKGSSLKYFDI